MRILLVNSRGADRGFGGAERYVRDLRDGLARRGHEPAVLAAFPALRDDSATLRTLHRTDPRQDRMRWALGHAGDWLAMPSPGVARMLGELAPDLVHTNNLPAISTSIWELARRRGIPVVHTLHDYGLLCPRVSLTRRDGAPCHPHPLLCGLRTRRLTRWAPSVSAVIGVSAHVVARHQGFFAAATPTYVVGAPLVPVPGAPAPPAPPAGLRTLGYLGALTIDKGVDALLDAAPRLTAQGVRVRLAGDGPLAAAVAAVPGIECVGRLLGADVGRFLAGCDAGVVPSRWEEPGLTFAALEWLGAGRPVLASSRGGLAELGALGGVHGIEPSADGIVDAVTRLRETPEAWPALAATVPQVAGDDDLERWLDDHLEVYARATANHGR